MLFTIDKYLLASSILLLLLEPPLSPQFYDIRNLRFYINDIMITYDTYVILLTYTRLYYYIILYSLKHGK